MMKARSQKAEVRSRIAGVVLCLFGLAAAAQNVSVVTNNVLTIDPLSPRAQYECARADTNTR